MILLPLQGLDIGEHSKSMSFWTLSIVWYSNNYKPFRKLNLFSSSGEGDKPTMLSALEKT
jgi:hypothetical protein